MENRWKKLKGVDTRNNRTTFLIDAYKNFLIAFTVSWSILHKVHAYPTIRCRIAAVLINRLCIWWTYWSVLNRHILLGNLSSNKPVLRLLDKAFLYLQIDFLGDCISSISSIITQMTINQVRRGNVRFSCQCCC